MLACDVCCQVGDSGVGKTSILLRFTQGDFKSDTRNTVGVDLKVKMITFRQTKLKLTIWDTGTREQRGTAGAVLEEEQLQFASVRHWFLSHSVSLLAAVWLGVQPAKSASARSRARTIAVLTPCSWVRRSASEQRAA